MMVSVLVTVAVVVCQTQNYPDWKIHPYVWVVAWMATIYFSEQAISWVQNYTHLVHGLYFFNKILKYLTNIYNILVLD